MSQRAVAEPAAFERAGYLRALNRFDLHLRENGVQAEQREGTQ
ncbi:MAG TPA: hypothetical protein VFV38_06210 [Ktedonobacteraceae bacterium]|nr:hypothetical protein [Ktedonobacteraceae bacterium]